MRWAMPVRRAMSFAVTVPFAVTMTLTMAVTLRAAIVATGFRRRCGSDAHRRGDCQEPQAPIVGSAAMRCKPRLPRGSRR